MPVPLFCDAFIGEAITERSGDAGEFVESLEAAMTALVEGTRFPEWE